MSARRFNKHTLRRDSHESLDDDEFPDIIPDLSYEEFKESKRD